MGLAMGNFYEPDLALWVWVMVLAAVVAVVAVAMGKWLPIPFLAAPFIVTFWVIWFIADARPELIKLDFGPWPVEDVKWVVALVDALGATLFAPAIPDRVFFFLGVLVSNWRHAVIALVAAFIAVALAAHIGTAGGAINTGFVGFNAVLAALGAAAVLEGDLRLAILAALLGTWFFSYINRNAPVPALASGFVLAVWTVMFLDWLHWRLGRGRRPHRRPGTSSPPSEIEPFGHLGVGPRPASVGWRIGRRMLSACGSVTLTKPDDADAEAIRGSYSRPRSTNSSTAASIGSRSTASRSGPVSNRTSSSRSGATAASC